MKGELLGEEKIGACLLFDSQKRGAGGPGGAEKGGLLTRLG